MVCLLDGMSDRWVKPFGRTTLEHRVYLQRMHSRKSRANAITIFVLRCLCTSEG